MKKIYTAVLIALATLFTAAAADAPLSAEEFLANVRHPWGQQNYAKLSGEIRHRRAGTPTEYSEIYLGILMMQNMRSSQLIIDDGESYRIGQSYTSGDQGSTVIPAREGGYPESILNYYGVRPEDLAMSFLYWSMVKEEKKQTMRTISCRVFLLKDQQSGEAARVFIAEKYFFPIKVEFFASADDLSTPLRTMEVESFEQTEDEFWVPTELKLHGKKDGKAWRTMVVFKQVEAKVYDPAAPPYGLFREI